MARRPATAAIKERIIVKATTIGLTFNVLVKYRHAAAAPYAPLAAPTSAPVRIVSAPDAAEATEITPTKALLIKANELVSNEARPPTNLITTRLISADCNKRAPVVVLKNELSSAANSSTTGPSTRTRVPKTVKKDWPYIPTILNAGANN